MPKNMVFFQAIPGQRMDGFGNPRFMRKRSTLCDGMRRDDRRTIGIIPIKREHIKPVDMLNGAFGYNERTP